MLEQSGTVSAERQIRRIFRNKRFLEGPSTTIHAEFQDVPISSSMTSSDGGKKSQGGMLMNLEGVRYTVIAHQALKTRNGKFKGRQTNGL